MTIQWRRIPKDDGAVTNSADTTETQIGAGISIPNWARSIKAVRICHTLVTLTTDEEVAGYIRIYNDNNTLEPLFLPLPIAQCLTGALGTHQGYEPIVMPLEAGVSPNDTLRLACAYDAATTGVHTMHGYVLFSSAEPRFHIHADKSAVQTQSTTSVTPAATAVTIDTIVGKTSAIIGVWGYFVAGGGITAAQSVTGYVKIKSGATGWMEQELPLNIQPSGLGTQIQPNTKPVMWLHKSVVDEYMPSGVTVLPMPEMFNLRDKTTFTFVGYMDGTNTAAPTGRFGLIWKE